MAESAVLKGLIYSRPLSHKTRSFAIRSMAMGHPNVVFSDPQAAPRSSNNHVSVNREGLELVEEPLGVTVTLIKSLISNTTTIKILLYFYFMPIHKQ
jgi:hypothetical protein